MNWLLTLAFFMLSEIGFSQTVGLQALLHQQLPRSDFYQVFGTNPLPAYGAFYHQPMFRRISVSVGLETYRTNYYSGGGGCATSPYRTFLHDNLIVEVPIDLNYDLLPPQNPFVARAMVGAIITNEYSKITSFVDGNAANSWKSDGHYIQKVTAGIECGKTFGRIYPALGGKFQYALPDEETELSVIGYVKLGYTLGMTHN